MTKTEELLKELRSGKKFTVASWLAYGHSTELRKQISTIKKAGMLEPWEHIRSSCTTYVKNGEVIKTRQKTYWLEADVVEVATNG